MNECRASCLVPTSFHSELSSPGKQFILFFACMIYLSSLTGELWNIGRYDFFPPMQHVCLKITRWVHLTSSWTAGHRKEGWGGSAGQFDKMSPVTPCELMEQWGSPRDIKCGPWWVTRQPSIYIIYRSSNDGMMVGENVRLPPNTEVKYWSCWTAWFMQPT